MFLLMLLALIVIILAVITVVILSVGGAGFIIIFGDVIVCIGFIIWLIQRIWKKKH